MKKHSKKGTKKKGKSHKGKSKNQKLFIGIGIALALIIILAFAFKGNTNEGTTILSKEPPKTINEMFNVLNSEGYNAVREENIKVSSFAADDGAQTTIGETLIEFYSFNNKPKIQAGAKKAFENPERTVLENGEIIVVIYSANTELTSNLEELLI